MDSKVIFGGSWEDKAISLDIGIQTAFDSRVKLCLRIGRQMIKRGTSQMVDRQGTRLGRPPKGPISGKGATLATRITVGTRRALDAEAERTGRSVSQVVEIFLERAIKGNATFQEMVGGNATLEAAQLKLAQIARAIDEAVPDKWLAHFVLMDTWEKAIEPILGGGPVTSDVMATLRETSANIDMLQALLQTLNSRSADDPVVRRSREPIRKGQPVTIAAVLGAGSAMAFATDRCEDVIAALEALRSAGKTARVEIEAALVKIRAAAAQEIERDSKRAEASKLADAILAKITGDRQ